MNRVFVVLVFLGTSIFLRPAVCRDPECWVTKDIRVEGRGSDAVSAKEKALVDGQRSAFMALLKLLPVASSAKNALSATADKEILGLIYDFSVQKEKLFPGRYLALLTYRFSKSNVMQWLEKRQVPLAEAVTPPSPPFPPPQDSLDEAFAEVFGGTTKGTPETQEELLAPDRDCYVEIPQGALKEWFALEKKLTKLRKAYVLHLISSHWIVLRVSQDFLDAQECLGKMGLDLKVVENSWRLSTRAQS